MLINIFKRVKFKFRRKLFLITTSILLIAYTSMVSANIDTVSTIYQDSNENFSNPERGFYYPINPSDNNDNVPLDISELQKLREQNVTLLRRLYLIKQFQNQSLSKSFLDMMIKDFQTARQAGVKLILVFTYNWIGGGADATKSVIFSHLDQLKPLFAENYDVISYMDAGFIGYWGEWNRSTNNLDKNSEDRRDILFKILSVLPSQRMVTLRYPHHKIDAFNNNNPLTLEEAFNGSYRARTGATNNCFVASIDDGGTYNHTDPEIVDKQKQFLSLDNLYVVQAGEVCAPSQYDDCPNTLNELARMRWSALSLEVSDGISVMQKWETQGCMAEIKRRLGYRYRLLKSVISNKVKSGGQFLISFEITNDGWASAYNPRNLEVVLRNTQTRQGYYLTVDKDPRRWLPGANNVVDVTGGIPENMPNGEYEVLLNLPDPEPKLHNRPEFSIRFANQNVWEESTGYNYLLHKVVISDSAGGDNYSGKNFFKAIQ